MANSEEQIKTSPRGSLLARARERFPDRAFADPDAAEPQEGVADLDEAIDEMLEEYSTRQAEYDEKNKRLVELLTTDPDSAEFVQRWVESGDPRTALVETFGDDLGISEERGAEFRGQLESWRERKRANDTLNEEAEANWQKSLADLESWGDAKALSLEQKRDVMLRLLSIAFNGMVNKYGPEDFELAYNAINHDADVASARQEGEVAGRNERIAAARRDRAAVSAMPPAIPGGQGARSRERTPVAESSSPWAGVR
ncbi:MAG: hypothetical protein IKW99_03410 [Bacteroidales bacterium]|nr:hypothetical protein [Bacteroidales bacterium]